MYIMLLVTFLYCEAASECKRNLLACVLKQCTSVSLYIPVALCAPIFLRFVFFFNYPQLHILKLFPTILLLFLLYAVSALLDVFPLGKVYLKEAKTCTESCSLACRTLRTQHVLYPDKTPGHPHEFSKYSRRLSRCLPGGTVEDMVISLCK